MLMTSCNTSFSGLDTTLSSRQIEEELRLKRRKLMRRMTSSHIPMELNGIGGLVSRSQSMANFDPKERIKFNIRGTRYDVVYETLINPETCNSKLTTLTKDDEAYDKRLKEFYFDRNPQIFGCIIDYYINEEMHLPENMCVFAVKKELEFWELDAEVLASCCWNKYCKAEEDQRMLHSVVSEWSSCDNDAEEEVYNARHAAFKKRLWLFMNEPHTSLGAKIWSVFIILVIVLSIVVLSLETVIGLRQAPDIFWETLPNVTEKRLVYILENSKPHDALTWIEIVTLIVLTIEFVLRMATAPDMKKFCKALLNIADIVSIIPIWVMIGLELADVDFSRREKGAVVFAYYLMMLLRMLRLFRLFKLVKHYKTLKILLMAIKASYKELILLIILLTMGVIIYANVMFFVEVEYDNFMSIPEGFWWAIITMTTVGYGDLYPKSPLGQVIGSACAITGILVIALPVPVIANNFHAFYASAQAVQRMRDREESDIIKRKVERAEADRNSHEGKDKSFELDEEQHLNQPETNNSNFPEPLTIGHLVNKALDTEMLSKSDNLPPV